MGVVHQAHGRGGAHGGLARSGPRGGGRHDQAAAVIHGLGQSGGIAGAVAGVVILGFQVDTAGIAFAGAVDNAVDGFFVPAEIVGEHQGNRAALRSVGVLGLEQHRAAGLQRGVLDEALQAVVDLVHGKSAGVGQAEAAALSGAGRDGQPGGNLGDLVQRAQRQVAKAAHDGVFDPCGHGVVEARHLDGRADGHLAALAQGDAQVHAAGNLHVVGVGLQPQAQGPVSPRNVLAHAVQRRRDVVGQQVHRHAGVGADAGLVPRGDGHGHAGGHGLASRGGLDCETVSRAAAGALP